MTLMRQRDLTVADETETPPKLMVIESVGQLPFIAEAEDEAPAKRASPLVEYAVWLGLIVLGAIVYMLTSDRPRP